jgi:NAD(P)-dependent dehydrogenase (short-subunit alcohol dehydrogenase family)
VSPTRTTPSLTFPPDNGCSSSSRTEPVWPIGRLALVTGANNGIGFETTLWLARAGATVIMAGRDAGRLAAARTAIVEQVPDAALETLVLDLAGLASVREAASTVLASGRPLDLLINNAGVMAVPERHTTADGFELTFGTNHLGHFALTGRLLPALLAADAARVVTVSAIAARWRSGELVDLNSEAEYRPMGSYAKSKRANVVFTQELERRAAGTGLTAVVVHPGASRTGLPQHTPGWMDVLMAPLRPLLFQAADKAAWPSLYAATAPGIEGGGFYGPSRGLAGSPGPAAKPEGADDPEQGRVLWQASEELTGVAYAF